MLLLLLQLQQPPSNALHSMISERPKVVVKTDYRLTQRHRDYTRSRGIAATNYLGMKQRTLQWAHRAPCSVVPNPLLASRSCPADALQLWRQSGDEIPLSIRPKTPRLLLTQVSLRSSRNSRYRSWDLALREPAVCCSIPVLADADNYGGTAAVKSRYLLAQRRRDVTQAFTGCNDNTYPDAGVGGC